MVNFFPKIVNFYVTQINCLLRIAGNVGSLAFVGNLISLVVGKVAGKSDLDAFLGVVFGIGGGFDILMLVAFGYFYNAVFQPFVTDNAGGAAFILIAPANKVRDVHFLHAAAKSPAGKRIVYLLKRHAEHGAGYVKDRSVGALITALGLFNHGFQIGFRRRCHRRRRRLRCGSFSFRRRGQLVNPGAADFGQRQFAVATAAFLQVFGQRLCGVDFYFSCFSGG